MTSHVRALFLSLSPHTMNSTRSPLVDLFDELLKIIRMQYLNDKDRALLRRTCHRLHDLDTYEWLPGPLLITYWCHVKTDEWRRILRRAYAAWCHVIGAHRPIYGLHNVTIIDERHVDYNIGTGFVCSFYIGNDRLCIDLDDSADNDDDDDRCLYYWEPLKKPVLSTKLHTHHNGQRRLMTVWKTKRHVKNYADLPAWCKMTFAQWRLSLEK